jgi:polyisoprenoid-binding protein YceI
VGLSVSARLEELTAGAIVIATLILAALVGQATTYRIEPATAEAGFDLKATMHTVHGTTKAVTGEVRVVPGDAGALNLSGTIEIGVAELATGNDKRDATMHDKSLLADTYPAIVFAPLRFVPKGAPDADGAIAGTLTGTLTIRGTSKPTVLAATLTPQGGRILASGTFDVTWAEFGIPDPSFFVVRIEKSAHAHFRAAFVPVP